MAARHGSGKARTLATINGHTLHDVLYDGPYDGPYDTAQDATSIDPFFLGLGLANHHVGGYYWGRSLGEGG